MKSPETEDKTEEEVKSPMIEEPMEIPSENEEIETLETEDKVEEVKSPLTEEPTEVPSENVEVETPETEDIPDEVKSPLIGKSNF